MTAPASLDAPSKGMGPAFLNLASWPYRLEMVLATFALVIVILGWTSVAVGNVNIFQTVFWFLWPDLLAFIPIGIAARGSNRWPSWGPTLYNTGHTFLVLAPTFIVACLLFGAIYWPLLGWALHITMDRASGYYLRAPIETEKPAA